MLNSPHRILITGANGFIGSALTRYLMEVGYGERLSLAVRKGVRDDSNTYSLGNFNSKTDWSSALERCKVVIHAAGRAHLKKSSPEESYLDSLEADYEAAIQLVTSAANAGVSRFIYISSVLVNGNESCQPFTEDDIPMPNSAAGRVKFKIEQELCEIGTKAGMEFVIIRSPLVYGKNVPGNFGSLIQLVRKGFPLPLASIHNSRSFICIHNLTHLIAKCIEHPGAKNQVFMASDGEDMSTTELFRGLAQAMGKRHHLFYIPQTAIKLGSMVLGKKDLADRLFSSQQVDISKACNLLEWRPPYSVDAGLNSCFVKNSDYLGSQIHRPSKRT